jgi:phage terminase large subunit-like protein
MTIRKLEPAEQYIDDVLNDRITVCKWVRLAVERQVRDMERIGDPDFPFYFDSKAAMRKIAFSQEMRHIEGPLANAHLKIKLEPWQQFIDWCIFGWKRVGTGTRRYTKAYIEVARKNGKTLMASTGAWYCAIMDGEEGPQVYCVATKLDQAKIAWDAIKAQIDTQPLLRVKTKAYKQGLTITMPETHGVIKPIGRDSKTQDGLNPSFVLVDEYHAHPTAEMLNVMQNGMGARSQPLMYIITTAGFDKNGPCYQEERSMVTGILEQTLDPAPQNVFGIIFTLDDEDDWTDEKVWIKANPNLGVSVRLEFLRSQVAQALALPRKQNDVKTKNFNIWTQAASRWLSAESWDACNGPVPDLIGRSCFGGIDLSTTTDISAWVLCFPPIDLEKTYTFLYRFYIPGDNLLERERIDKVPYSLWAEQGFVTITDGNVIDYDYIEAQILKDAADYTIGEIAFDPYNATEITNHLSNEGLNMIPFRQGFASMTGPSKDFEKRVLGKELNHGNNPVIRWMVSCTEIASDPAGNIKPVKPDRGKTGRRIDGVVASIMALDRAVQGCTNVSVYEMRGVRVL